MANKQPNIQHLKQGRAIPDPIATAKVQGTGFSDTCKRATVYPTPDSQPSASDGRLSGKNSPDGGRGWAPINEAAKVNTYTSGSGSKRGD
jgi:hypothetical protein